MTHSTQSLSPFDEALQRQKQPLLANATTDDGPENINSRMTVDTNCTSYSNRTSYSPSWLLRLLNCRNAKTPPSSSEVLPFWSTKYRDDETYHDDEEEETMMIETIDFVRNSALNEHDTSDVECVRINEHHIMFSTTGTPAMKSFTTTRHSNMDQYLLHQQQLLRTQILNIIVGMVALIITAMLIVYIITSVFA